MSNATSAQVICLESDDETAAEQPVVPVVPIDSEDEEVETVTEQVPHDAERPVIDLDVEDAEASLQEREAMFSLRPSQLYRMQELQRAAKRALRRDRHVEQALRVIEVIREVQAICAVYDPTKGYARFSALARLDAAAAALENARTAAYDATQDAAYLQQLDARRQQYEHITEQAAIAMASSAIFECRRTRHWEKHANLKRLKGILRLRLELSDEHAWRTKCCLIEAINRA